MRIIDTHGHLYLPEFEDDLEAVVERSLHEGVEKVLLPDIDSGTTNILKRTVSTFPDFFAGMTGIHPTSVKHDYQKELDHFESEISSDFPWIGIGEIGIDLYWDKTYESEQKTVFRVMLQRAAELGLPVSVHQRNSMQEVLEILTEFNGRVRGILHCFGGDETDATRAIDLGYKLGIGGTLTFKNSTQPDIVKHAGIKHLVLETDAPYLAPMPFRGKRNEPGYLKYVVAMMAQLLQLTPEAVAEHTTTNALDVFPKISRS